MVRVLLIFGTRPEAIKLAPVYRELISHPDRFQVRVCVTAQHRELLDQVMGVFGIRADYDLDIMRPGQSLGALSARILEALEPVMAREAPHLALVQGDTTTTFCGALAAFYRSIPVGHVEAGLRTGNMRHPFPEEMNRVLTSHIAALHFAATEWAAENLRGEGTPDSAIHVTGNTGIDAVLYVKARLESGELKGWNDDRVDASKKLIVVTAHRRESFGEGMANICDALADLAGRGDVQIVYPVHPNPNVRGPVERLRGRPGILLVEPLEYVPFVDLMRRATILLTDSGGIQEEGPSLGKPVLVMRQTTERPEAVRAGTVKLVGASRENIVKAAAGLLDDPDLRRRMERVHNPYGDGAAASRILEVITSFCKENKFANSGEKGF
jgi:UDP-N-acetylglucosamine 2-epimerase (non-hydrolysing)